MRIIKAHKIRLNPTPAQEQYFWQAAGVGRFAWNWALGQCNERLAETGKLPKITGKGETLKAEFVSLKSEEWPWVGDVTTYAYQQAFTDLKKAFTRYFKLKASGQLVKPPGWKPRKDGKPFGWPRFKSKFRATPSFYESNNGLRFDGHNVRFPKIGWVDMTEELRYELGPKDKIMNGRVTYSGGHWWLAVQVEMEHEPPDLNLNKSAGVYLGVRPLVATSDGKRWDEPRVLKNDMARLRRVQRKYDRQLRANNPDNYLPDGKVKSGPLEWKISNKMKRTKLAIQKMHARIANVRRDAAHKATTEIVRTYDKIALVDFSISEMMHVPWLAPYLADAAIYEKRRMLEYKAKWAGVEVIKTPGRLTKFDGDSAKNILQNAFPDEQ